jgi:hypothetical protein
MEFNFYFEDTSGINQEYVESQIILEFECLDGELISRKLLSFCDQFNAYNHPFESERIEWVKWLASFPNALELERLQVAHLSFSELETIFGYLLTVASNRSWKIGMGVQVLRLYARPASDGSITARQLIPGLAHSNNVYTLGHSLKLFLRFGNSAQIQALWWYIVWCSTNGDNSALETVRCLAGKSISEMRVYAESA